MARQTGFFGPLVATSLAASVVIAACTGGGGDSPESVDSLVGSSPAEGQPPPELAIGRFTDVSAAKLPTGDLGGQCMDATHGDLDGDGDPDLVLAQEHATNLVLLNDGEGGFSIGSLQGGDGDNEDVRLADLDDDGDLDLVAVHEDDGVHATFRNDGEGGFTEDQSLLPSDLRSTANALELADLNADGRIDLLIGNAGTNLVLLQGPDGTFVDDTEARPIGGDTTQDLLLVDVDGDGDDDLFVVNEEQNRLLINRGDGTYIDETDSRLPGASAESREADAADVDGDGDLDIVVANVKFNRDVDPVNQLLRNDGDGNFTDHTADGLATVSNRSSSFTIRLVDLDGDGASDVLSPNNELSDGGTIEVWINDGDGSFGPPDRSPFVTDPTGSTFHIEVADLNGDGKADLYFCNRTGSDQLYLAG